jgi:3-hydroxybutyryl-CoA dehydrogenase
MNFKTIGIVGAGAMGRGIAQLAATAGHSVFVYDISEEMVLEAKQYIQLSLEKLVSKGKMEVNAVKQILGNCNFTTALAAFESCDLIIEAVVERLDIKQQLFASLENMVSDQAILASNTSSLSISAIASAIKTPERVVGLHFFNPAVVMPLVEIIPAVQTNHNLLPDLHKLMISWGKAPVEAKDTPGFIVNRIARPYYSEAIRIMEEGIADCQTIDFAMTQMGGFKMGPFVLMDFIGHDVNFSVTKSMYESCFHEPRYKPSFSQQRLVEAGYLGRKSGRGFYVSNGPETGSISIQDAKSKQIFDRILTMLINEAADALYFGIATREDIDTAMTKGVNYPKGLLQWGDELGWSNIEKRMDELFDFYHDPRYRASPMVRKLAKA